MTAQTVMVLGASGMLGRAVIAEAVARGKRAVGLARSGTDFSLDIRDLVALRRILDELGPDIVVNVAANTSLEQCEEDPGDAYMVNARPAACIARYCAESDARLIHVSTDHFYCGDRDVAHSESAPVVLVNEYSRTKFAAEALAATCADALILRTCIIGMRGNKGRPTLIEWVLGALERHEPMRLFSDAYHSPIAVQDFAAGMFDLLDCGATGIFNLAGREVASKARLVETVGRFLGILPDWASNGSVAELQPARGDSLGLDVTLAESLLARRLPCLEETVDRVLAGARLS